jgi:nucleoside-diphosphate-sugar epimerase
MSDILITGGYGLIGHNVVRKLKDLRHRVCVVDTETNYGIIPDDEIEYLMSERKKKVGFVETYKFDISDKFLMSTVFRRFQPDAVIHMASFPRQKVVNANPMFGSRVMSEGLLNLLERSKEYNVKKFVYISSSMVYGDFTDDVTEDAVCKPQGQYGIMKLAGEWLTRDYTRSTGMAHTIIRPSAVYGPLDVEDRVIAKFMLTAMRGGTLKVNGAGETLDFTYVDDAAEGIVSATLSDNTLNKTYNITKSHSRTLLDAARLAVNIVGKGNVEIREKDKDFPSRGALNIDAAKADFGYNPKVDVEEGFQKYYEWLKESSFWNSKI